MSSDHQEHRPLISGAGPVGLAAGLFLARAGIPFRIIEKKADPRGHSRALVVNPRTLALLEETGVTEQLLGIGKNLRGAMFWSRGRVVGRVEMDRLAGKYPFLLGVSQSVTERLLETALERAGGRVERETELTDCRVVGERVEVVVRSAGRSSEAGVEQRCSPRWVLAADGAHSFVRGALDIAMGGNTFARDWRLIDVPLRTGLDEEHAHLIVLPKGRFLFAVRVIDDARPEQAAPLWRVLGNLLEMVEQLPDTEVAGPAVWTSLFRPEHRIVETMQRGPVFLAGDAAHVHSPVGARGMNLGIEDAWVFAKLVAAGRMGDYARLRRKVDRAVVRRVSAIAKVATGESAAGRVLRRWGLPMVMKVGPVREIMAKTVSGLDHPLPVVC